MFELFENPTIDRLIEANEGQLFDRVSERIGWRELGNLMVGFANAEGGVVAVGIDQDKTVTGVKDIHLKSAEINKAALQWIKPPLAVKINPFSCKNFQGGTSHVLLLEIPLSNEVLSNQKDEVYLRIGDENIKLNHKQRMVLLDEKGKVRFELSEATGATLRDLDEEVMEDYRSALKIPGTPTEDLLLGRDLASKKEGKLIINKAGILLFGKNPEKWVERARVRVLKYEGIIEKTGERMNIVKDIPIYGPLPYQVKRSYEVLDSLLRDFSVLDTSGRFITQKEYPEFVWKEAMVNALVHRAYVLRGADIQVKMFDDRLEVNSPGGFPGFVTQKNIRDVHYSRNPRIARVMTELGFIKELGEGVNRMIEEMERANLPEPVFTEVPGQEVLVKLENNISMRNVNGRVDLRQEIEQELISSLAPVDQKIISFVIAHDKITTQECEKLIGKHKMTALRNLRSLVNRKFLQRVGEKGPKVYYTLGIKIRKFKSETRKSKRTRPIQKGLFPD